MIEREDQKKLEELVGKYYEFSSLDIRGDSITFRVPTFLLQPEQNFISLSKELDRIGYLTFTSTSEVDEIIIMPKPPAAGRNDFRIKLALFIATLACVLYYGYIYQVSYEGSNNPIGNFLTSLIFYLVPLAVIMAGREATKYAAMKRNGMQYDFPIFVPNPLGIGSMGMINTPNKPYVSKKAMIEAGSFSIIAGFTISTVFLVIGSLATFNFPPSVPIVNSPVQTIGSPLIMQLIVNRLIPSNGILDPLALAGWSGIVITAFNALPLGFLDGGLIASALFGRNSTYLSYVSILIIVVLGVIYPPWIILAVFALLVGLRGPQPLNNITKVRANTKALAAISFAIIVVGIAPFPFHAGINTFSAATSQEYFLLYGGNNSIQLNVTVNNTGQATIVPAFEISPSVNFQLSGESRTISPGSQFNYTLDLRPAQNMPLGFNKFEITVYSGSYYKVMPITILKVNLTKAFTFNNNNPYSVSIGNQKNFTLQLMTAHNASLYLVSMGGPNMSFYYYLQNNNYSKISYNENFVYVFSAPEATPPSTISIVGGTPLPLNFGLNSDPAYWYIVAYDSHYNAAVAEYQSPK